MDEEISSLLRIDGVDEAILYMIAVRTKPERIVLTDTMIKPSKQINNSKSGN